MCLCKAEHICFLDKGAADFQRKWERYLRIKMSLNCFTKCGRNVKIIVRKSTAVELSFIFTDKKFII